MNEVCKVSIIELKVLHMTSDTFATAWSIELSFNNQKENSSFRTCVVLCGVMLIGSNYPFVVTSNAGVLCRKTGHFDCSDLITPSHFINFRLKASLTIVTWQQMRLGYGDGFTVVAVSLQREGSYKRNGKWLGFKAVKEKECVCACVW